MEAEPEEIVKVENFLLKLSDQQRVSFSKALTSFLALLWIFELNVEFKIPIFDEEAHTREVSEDLLEHCLSFLRQKVRQEEYVLIPFEELRSKYDVDTSKFYYSIT